MACMTRIASVLMAPLLMPMALVVSMAQAPAPPAATVDQLAWLTGCWSLARPNGALTEEHWMAPRGGTMLGMSRTVRGEKTVEFEYIQIRTENGVLAYEARPSRQPVALFPLKSLEDGTVTFENPSHDFPQRVIYRRTDGGVTARIEGTMNGTARGIDFPYRRC
jgi:hypothetical protein